MSGGCDRERSDEEREIDRLRAEVARLRRERDDERKMWARLVVGTRDAALLLTEAARAERDAAAAILRKFGVDVDALLSDEPRPGDVVVARCVCAAIGEDARPCLPCDMAEGSAACGR